MYRKLVLQLHPDKHSGKQDKDRTEWATIAFRNVQSRYESIINWLDSKQEIFDDPLWYAETRKTKKNVHPTLFNRRVENPKVFDKIQFDDCFEDVAAGSDFHAKCYSLLKRNFEAYVEHATVGAKKVWEANIVTLDKLYKARYGSCA